MSKGYGGWMLNERWCRASRLPQKFLSTSFLGGGIRESLPGHLHQLVTLHLSLLERNGVSRCLI